MQLFTSSCISFSKLRCEGVCPGHVRRGVHSPEVGHTLAQNNAMVGACYLLSPHWGGCSPRSSLSHPLPGPALSFRARGSPERTHFSLIVLLPWFCPRRHASLLLEPACPPGRGQEAETAPAARTAQPGTRNGYLIKGGWRREGDGDPGGRKQRTREAATSEGNTGASSATSRRGACHAKSTGGGRKGRSTRGFVHVRTSGRQPRVEGSRVPGGHVCKPCS